MKKFKFESKQKSVKPLLSLAKTDDLVRTDSEINHELINLNERTLPNSLVDSRAEQIKKLDFAKTTHAISKRKLANKKKELVKNLKVTLETQILNTENSGFLEPDVNVPTYNVLQAEITSTIDMATAAKSFSLDLAFGPYRFDYGITGRELIIGGKKGHIGVFDWLTKDLKLEKDMLESINDVSFLHVSTLFATAQKRWVHIYDEQGVEIHCMKSFNEPKLLEFLPRHLLLVATTATNYLHYLDISTGSIVASFQMKQEGNPQSIKKNEANGVLLTAGSSGNVCMWTPNDKKAIVKIKAHPGMIRGLAVDHSGNYFATAGTDQRVKIFDIRNYQQLHVANVSGQINGIDVSQKNCLAVASGQRVLIYEDVVTNGLMKPYLNHFVGGDVRQIEFCAHEDILGIGHSKGFSSIIVPGSGDPHMSGFMHNPFESKKQRREREVRMLLDKLQPEMICLDPSQINRVKERVEKIVEEAPVSKKPKKDWGVLNRFERK